MEGKPTISRYRLEKAKRALTQEGQKILHLAEPLIEGKPEELAIWFATIQHLLENDLDLGTKQTAEMYSELSDSNPLWLLTEYPLIQKSLETLIPTEKLADFQKVYEIVHTSYQNPGKLARKAYPEYIEIAAKWWFENNVESLTTWQQDRFLARLKKRMEEQFQEAKMLLICTMQNNGKNFSKISVHLGGMENTVLYPEYMAMIGTKEEILVQRGRMSNWFCIWKAEIVETEGEKV